MSKRRFIPAYGAPAEAPMSELNTTPLIDVMLVLLIMFIITIPITTHKVPLDLPQRPPVTLPEKPVIHMLELDAAGGISLDGASISLAELPARLAAIQAGPVSDLLLRAHGEAPYDRFDHVMATVKRAGVTRLGMVGNERFVPALD